MQLSFMVSLGVLNLDYSRFANSRSRNVDPQDPQLNLYDVDDASTVITLEDWYVGRLATWTEYEQQSQVPYSGARSSRTVLLDEQYCVGGSVSTIHMVPILPFDSETFPRVPDSGLINGKGRYVGGPTVKRSVINVTKGKRYRLRVINISAIGSYTFSIEGHSMTIIVSYAYKSGMI